MEQRKLDEAAKLLNDYLSTKPDSVEAWNLLRVVHWQKSGIPVLLLRRPIGAPRLSVKYVLFAR